MQFTRIPTLVIFVIGSIATLVLSLAVARVIRLEDFRKFEEIVANIERPLEVRLKRYEIALIHTRAFLISIENRASLSELKSYVEKTELLKNHPGAQGLGFTIRLDSKAISKTGAITYQGEKFQLWPLEPKRDGYFAIVFLYPLDWRNKRAIGYDMYSDSIRRTAMRRAWETGKPALTAKVTLVQETESDAQPGFLLYLPYYRTGAPIETQEERRKALIGFVYAPFRSIDFMQSVIPAGVANVDYQLYSNDVHPDNLLYDNKRSSESDPLFSTNRIINLGGQKFILAVQSLPRFTGTYRRLIPYVVGLMGLLFTSLICFTIHRLRKAAMKDREAKDTLETLNRIGRRVSAELDLDKLVQDITDAATQVCRAQFGALFYNVMKADGEAYTLYSLSGVPREAFSKFPLPRNTQVFNPTFVNSGVVRSDDITKDPRYGKNAPHNGMPAGHLPVRSYLAVSVVSRTGDVLGGLFFGHKDVGVFTERDETLMVGFASQAAIAIDNANLYRRSQEAIQARDEFLSVCSHELKTPLTSLQLEAQINERLIKKHGDQAVTPERFKEMIETTRKQAASLTSLVDDMLDIGRISTGKLQLRPTTIEFNQVLDEGLRSVMPQFTDAGVELKIEVPSEPIEVNWDKLRVAQVLSNLLTNSLKYGNRKPVKLIAEVLAQDIKISVEDQGQGVPDKHREKIFQRFERASADRNISGLGLGLFIARKIAESHDGTLTLENNEGSGGSRFIVLLPIHPKFLANSSAH